MVIPVLGMTRCAVRAAFCIDQVPIRTCRGLPCRADVPRDRTRLGGNVGEVLQREHPDISKWRKD